MRLSLAIATLFLAATTALPASASAPNGHYFYSHQQGYRTGASPDAAARHPAVNGWSHCVGGLEQGGRSAYPSWDVC